MQTPVTVAKHGNTFAKLVKESDLLSPSGLMVFSSDSLSFDFPLDMSAAMEKAFAREES